MRVPGPRAFFGVGARYAAVYVIRLRDDAEHRSEAIDEAPTMRRDPKEHLV